MHTYTYIHVCVCTHFGLKKSLQLIVFSILLNTRTPYLHLGISVSFLCHITEESLYWLCVCSSSQWLHLLLLLLGFFSILPRFLVVLLRCTVCTWLTCHYIQLLLSLGGYITFSYSQSLPFGTSFSKKNCFNQSYWVSPSPSIIERNWTCCSRWSFYSMVILQYCRLDFSFFFFLCSEEDNNI